ncbi:MAG: phosphoglycerate kinase [Pelagibacteraceae bacterium BACL5 MAG-120705-bin12]|jgi:phosphoglycerate kinase|uniref:phosphoglycerate kinase n=1 Tax=Candidatus Pelagibacter sp. TaxID=2024849 RepID=UPI000715CF54|nr:MAG: phosphoglycerate kinase [Pelagibacteraceae bacterium BACL5 MAG-121015-bin10]KRO61525.1 MAG: phosphoglycerate kinase [Pelagibacteraceae bacterium BACL5 MAG-120705-bin12]
MKSITEVSNLENKRVILRLDLNVPLKNQEIQDETRILKILPVINFLIEKKAKIIIISHVGRPKGEIQKELSLIPICENLKSKLNKDIKLITNNLLEIKKNDLFTATDEEIIFLENIRFYKEEEENDENFSKHLASLADLYVNDAFSCSHRAHASVCKITEFLPAYAGLQLNSEVEALKKVTSEIKKPVTCIIGGSKISTKIGIIKNLIPKFDNIIIVGGMANNILEYNGHSIGKSIKEDNCKDIIDEIFKTSKKFSCSIVYPEDVAVGKNLADASKIKSLNEIENDDLILDIGPKTIEKIKLIIERSKTLLWNGPAGYFENINFANGSFEIAKKIVEKNNNNSIYSVAGGGDTNAVLNQIGAIEKFNFVSTAGGAFLEYLEGKDLPGITALN